MTTDTGTGTARDATAPAAYLHLAIYYRTDEDAANVAASWALPDAVRPAIGETVHLEDSGPIPADEGDFDFPYRQVTASGWITAGQLAALREEWSLEPEDAEPNLGFLADLGDGIPRVYPDERHTADGMDWNVGGWTPVLWADLSLVIPPEDEPADEDYATAWACVDCFVVIVNGDEPEDEDYAAAWRERFEAHAPDACDIFPGLRFGEDGCEHTAEAWREDPDAAEAHALECETRDFSWAPCDLCRSPLGGSRHAVTFTVRA